MKFHHSGEHHIATTSNKGNRRNQDIRAPQVRVIGADTEQIGIRSREEALSLAADAGLDLVEIQPHAEPPVCRIMDFGKYKFEAQKKASAARKKQKQVEVKEVKFRPTTDIGDYEIKLRNVHRFLDDGDKVKVTIRFRGREMAHQDLGRELARRIQGDIEEDGVVEQFPRLEGRLMVMMIGPKKS